MPSFYRAKEKTACLAIHIGRFIAVEKLDKKGEQMNQDVRNHFVIATFLMTVVLTVACQLEEPPSIEKQEAPRCPAGSDLANFSVQEDGSWLQRCDYRHEGDGHVEWTVRDAELDGSYRRYDGGGNLIESRIYRFGEMQRQVVYDLDGEMIIEAQYGQFGYLDSIENSLSEVTHLDENGDGYVEWHDHLGRLTDRGYYEGGRMEGCGEITFYYDDGSSHTNTVFFRGGSSVSETWDCVFRPPTQ